MTERRRIEWLDYARIVATLGILVFHYSTATLHGVVTSIGSLEHLLPVTAYGFVGVDLFFMVSGYVVVQAAMEQPPGRFAIGRAVRLYPAFLVCMTATAIVDQASGRDITWGQYLANLLLPGVFGQPGVDGVYWTLAYELKFYILVWLGLLVRRGKLLPTMVIGWAAVIGVNRLLDLDLPFSEGFFALFAGGALLARAANERVQWPVMLALAAMVVVSADHAYEFATTLDTAGLRYISPAIAAALVAVFYGGFFLLGMAKPKLPSAAFAGDLTYPFYLLHAHIGYTLLNWIGSPDYQGASLGLAVAIVVTFAAAVHIYVERRPRALWYRWANAVVIIITRLLASPRKPVEQAAE
ncbi:MAG TPA: acyltransferase [Allosphingosinicella sp.]